MKLSDLTDPHAVVDAMQEYDLLGRDVFLSRHGYKKARSYMLVHNGRQYDSKAIAGVALKYQFPNSDPVKAKDFSGGEATVRTSLQRLGFEVKQIGDPFIRNPDWTRDETILALDLLVRRRPQLPDQSDREVIALSELLRDFAEAQNLKRNAKYRNPDGVSMKIANLSRLDADDGRKGLPHGAKTEEAVWGEFILETEKLVAAAKSIREAMQYRIADIVPERSDAANEPMTSVQVSRGPRPLFGTIEHVRTDGENCVYLMQLAGPLAEMFPGRDLTRGAVIKIGRTNDVLRRAAELNCGFPPGMAIRWQLVKSAMFPNADIAHDTEQAILKSLSIAALTIGGEFAIVPQDKLPGLCEELSSYVHT